MIKLTIFILTYVLGYAIGCLIGKEMKKSMFNKKLIETLKRTINTLEEEVDEKNTVIKDYQKENVVLLENSIELRTKIVDLENNIELLVNNSKSKKIRELADLPQSN